MTALIKFNAFAQAFLLFVSVVNAALFYLLRGNEEIILGLYVFMFLAQLLIVLSLLIDMALNRNSNKYLAFVIIALYVTSLLYFGSETDTLLYKCLLLVSLFMLVLYAGFPLKAGDGGKQS